LSGDNPGQKLTVSVDNSGLSGDNPEFQKIVGRQSSFVSFFKSVSFRSQWHRLIIVRALPRLFQRCAEVPLFGRFFSVNLKSNLTVDGSSGSFDRVIN
jgi:hypothetical protein